MAFKHNTSDTADGILTQGEYESTSGHVLDSQAAGDMIVADTTTTMTRLAVGSANQVLTSDGSTPTYSKVTTSNIDASTLVIESEGIGSNDNDTTIPTSAAVKDYVDNTTTAEDLDFTGDSGGPSAVDLDSQTLTIAGTTNEIETSVSGQTLTVGIVTNPTIGGNLTVTGDLTVNGTTTTVDTTNTIVKDPLIELNTGAASNANDLGIVMERGSTGDNAIVAWDESADGFIVGTTTATGASTGNLTIAAAPLTASTFTGNLTGNVTGNVSGTAATVTDATQAAITTTANLSTVGTITTGTWQATDVGVEYGGTGVSTLTDGGVLVGNGTGAVQATAVGTSGQVLTSNGSGSDPTFQDAAAGGLAHASQFRLTTGFTGTATPITSNWEEVDTDGYDQLGTAVTESSGIFTFPATGIYYITWECDAFSDGQGATTAIIGELQTSVNAGSGDDYNTASRWRMSLYTSSATHNGYCSFIFDVTNTTTHKVRASITANAATINGDTGQNRNALTFIKLGDT